MITPRRRRLGVRVSEIARRAGVPHDSVLRDHALRPAARLARLTGPASSAALGAAQARRCCRRRARASSASSWLEGRCRRSCSARRCARRLGGGRAVLAQPLRGAMAARSASRLVDQQRCLHPRQARSGVVPHLVSVAICASVIGAPVQARAVSGPPEGVAAATCRRSGAMIWARELSAAANRFSNSGGATSAAW